MVDRPRVRRLILCIAFTAAAVILSGSATVALAAPAAIHARRTCWRVHERSLHSGHDRVLVCRTDTRATHSRTASRRRLKRLSVVNTLAAASLVRSSAIAQVLATPCQNTGLTPAPGNLALVRSAVLCLVNRERAENGEPPLVLNAELEKAAEGHNNEMIADDYFAHISPAGESPVDRLKITTSYIPGPKVGYVIGENLAWGTLYLSTPQAIVEAWIASPGHLANILEARYRETGIGVVPSVPASLAGGEPGATYAQEFGVIIR